MDNLKTWNTLRQPPADMLKTIKAGRLKNFTDVNPMWRYKAMTEVFGMCGIGWKYNITRLWIEPAANEQVCAFANIDLFVKVNGEWSDPIPGVGGSMLTAKESSGLHSSDECFKMAVTDALSVSMKMIGVAADIYLGMWDGSKYKDAPPESAEKITTKHINDLARAIEEGGFDADEKLKSLATKVYKIERITDLPDSKFDDAMKRCQSLRKDSA